MSQRHRLWFSPNFKALYQQDSWENFLSFTILIPVMKMIKNQLYVIAFYCFLYGIKNVSLSFQYWAPKYVINQCVKLCSAKTVQKNLLSGLSKLSWLCGDCVTDCFDFFTGYNIQYHSFRHCHIATFLSITQELTSFSLLAGADPGYVKRGGRDPKGGGGRVADITRK